MGTYLILVCLLSVCSFSFTQECNRELSLNVEFQGPHTTFVYSPDAKHCQYVCTEEPSCLFFTFIQQASSTNDRRRFYCYLKSTPSGSPEAQKPHQGVTSGFSLKSCSPETRPCLSQVYHGLNMIGDDYQTLFTADYTECQRVCTNDPACHFFTFVDGTLASVGFRYKCHLRLLWEVQSPIELQKRFGVVSGFSNKNEMFQRQFDTACQEKLFPNSDIAGKYLLHYPAVSPENCQALCSAHPACTFFTFDSESLTCYLKSNRDEMVISNKEGVTSGMPARFCQPNDHWLKVSYEGIDFFGPHIRYELMDDAETCKRTCNEDANCQFYTYVSESFRSAMYSRRCYLRRVSILNIPSDVKSLPGVVSGFNKRSCVSRAPPTNTRTDIRTK